MDLVTSFLDFLQPFSTTMRRRSFENLTTMIVGWVFASRHTVSRMIGAARDGSKKHFSTFYRLFSEARWSRDALGHVLFALVEPWLAEGSIHLALDDTLARKRGPKVFGAGMHHNPLLSTRKTAVMNWGHSWVVLGVLVRFPRWPERTFCLPILFRLYLNRKASERRRRVHRTRPELAVEMLAVVCAWRKTRRFHVAADSAYGGQSVLNHLPENCDLTSRLLMQARLYGAPPERRPGTNGRPRVRGERLPTPSEMLAGRGRRADLQIYGRRDRVRLVDAVGSMHAAPRRRLRIVAVEPLSGGRTRQAFYSTSHESTGETVLAFYAERWSIEVAFHDCKQSLGFEEPQGWTKWAVERTAPLAMLLYGLIILWYARDGHSDYQEPDRPWYTTKRRESFADMLVTLRRASVRELVSSWAPSGPGTRKLLHALENAVARTG
jgi:hypothetical protein